MERGTILDYDFPAIIKDQKASKVLQGTHRAVVLHKRGTPYNTILIAPITKSQALKGTGKIPANYVELKKDKYPVMLTDDCYINLDMIIPVDEEFLDKHTINNGTIKVNCKLDDYDLWRMDYRLSLTFEMGKFINTEVADEIKSIVEYIHDTKEERIKSLLGEQNDPKVIAVINELNQMLEEICTAIREEYLNKEPIYNLDFKNQSDK